MGYVIGADTKLNNSAYTLAYKSEKGVSSESITDNQATNIKKYNGNVYVNRGTIYDLFEQGVMADGTPFDQLINLDLLTSQIQAAIMDALVNNPKIPQTSDGVNLLISAIAQPCISGASRGFIAPGVWNAPSISNLKTGDMLSSGYAIMADSIDSQPQADRDARIAPPIYVAIKLAGAIEHVVISISVNA